MKQVAYGIRNRYWYGIYQSDGGYHTAFNIIEWVAEKRESVEFGIVYIKYPQPKTINSPLFETQKDAWNWLKENSK